MPTFEAISAPFPLTTTNVKMNPNISAETSLATSTFAGAAFVGPLYEVISPKTISFVPQSKRRISPSLFYKTEDEEDAMNAMLSTPAAFSANSVPIGFTSKVRGNPRDSNILKLEEAQISKMPFSLASQLNIPQAPQDYHLGHYPVEVIGHRGSLYTALENTSRSFVHAAQFGADGIELDVFLLKCGTLVVFHGSGGDEEPGLLHSYCGVEGSILDYTADEAKRILTFNKNFAEFGCGPSQITHPADQSNDGNSIPHYCYVHTLEEVLTTLRDHPDVPSNFSIKIELKGANTAIPSVELVRKLNMSHRCQYSSFDHSRIAQVRQMEPSAITGALFADDIPHDFVQHCLSIGATEVHLKYDTCTRDRIKEAHEAGLGTMAWFRGPIGMKEDTASKYFDVGNEDESMYEMVVKSGVKSMCVNRPDVMVSTLERIGRRIDWSINPDADEEKKVDWVEFQASSV